VRLELDSQNDLLHFSQILHTPAGQFLRSSLKGHYAPDCQPTEEQVVPLRLAPSDEKGRERLAQVVEGADEPGPPEPRPTRCPEIVWLDPGEFTMGSPEDEAGRLDNERQHRVRITGRFGMGKYPVTQAQYEEIMGVNPSRFQNAGADAPVEQVSWEEAMEFCRRLTEREQESGKLPEGYVYTLPTEAQWEYASRAGTTTATYAGDLTILGECNAPVLDAIAWYTGNSGVNYEGGLDSSGWPEKQYDHQRVGTHPVGQKQPNAWGLHDMLGNVWEWCADWYGEYDADEAMDPWGPAEGSERVVRGGSWHYLALLCRTAHRFTIAPGERYFDLGFRVAAVQEAELAAREREGRPRALELAWLEPGEFTMGSPEDEAVRVSDERQHHVGITRRFGMGKYTVTQSQYEEIMAVNPSHFHAVGRDAPVERVSWEEAMEFCRRLTERDHESGKLPEAYVYTLPTEAQWEYACRAGTTTPFHFGKSLSSKQANFNGNYPYGGEKGPYLKETTPVGAYPANAWGLYDMHGNVWEWCADWYGDYGEAEVLDPCGPARGSRRVVRGGSWYDHARDCRSACRGRDAPGGRDFLLGFRVAAVQSVELQAREPEGRRRAP
jgi:formylglycine-generating enzyme required for sulfatase activity